MGQNATVIYQMDSKQTIQIVFLDEASDFLNGWSVIDLIFQDFRNACDTTLYIIKESED